MVAKEPEAVREFFGFDDARWPDEEVRFDLGGRVLTAIGAPGHHAAGVVFHDPATGFLLTGDTVYPGRIYVADYPELVATLNRLVAFCATHEVTLGDGLPRRDDGPAVSRLPDRRPRTSPASAHCR